MKGIIFIYLRKYNIIIFNLKGSLQMKTLHEKIKNYLITQNLLGIKLIAKEKICYIKKKENGRFKIYKLDLLGADEDLFYFIEIKTGVVSKADIEKYIEIFYNFNFLHKGVKIIFVAKNISKNAERAIKESRCNIEIVWFDELDLIEKIEVKKVEIIPYTKDLDEYRLSFVLRMYFNNIKSKCFNTKFIRKYTGNLPAVEFTLLNKYTIILYFHNDNYVEMDLYWEFGKEGQFYYIRLYERFNSTEMQLRFINDLITEIITLNYKITNEEYHSIAEKIMTKINIKIDNSKLAYQLIFFR